VFADLSSIVLRLAIIVGSLAVHEAAHGLAARWLGDPTASRLGRITLNPLKHLDLQGSLIVPGLLLASQWAAGTNSSLVFGWAKPVPVDPGYFRRPFLGMALVAAAGPASNILLALAGAQLLEGAQLAGFGLRDPHAMILLPFVAINVALALFNMIPVPPLDGSKILWGPLFPFMPDGFRRWYANLPPGQRLFGPILAVLAIGFALYLLGFDPLGWFNWLWRVAFLNVLAFIFAVTDFAWAWL
jgi:Zn-dependent protease